MVGAKKELGQMHTRRGFHLIAVAELTRRERLRAHEGLMLLTQKQTVEWKGRLVYNGKNTREWISREDKSSPTVLTESLMLTCTVDAAEGQDVMSLDIPNAYIQALVPAQGVGNRIVMKARGKLVEWLLEIDPTAYAPHVVIERGLRRSTWW